MRIGSAWVKAYKDKEGNERKYISISVDIPFLGKLSLALFKVDEKRSENSPDYSVTWSPEKKKPISQTGNHSDYYDDSDIPFD